MALGERGEGVQAEVHPKAPALVPKKAGPWALGAGLVLHPWLGEATTWRA